MLSPNQIVERVLSNPALAGITSVLMRAMLAFMFIVSGWGKITGYDGTAAYMASQGVPGALLPLVILTELGGGIAILIGFQTRFVAFLLAGFTVLTALLFHDGSDMNSHLMFMKNIAIAGGFLSLMLFGAGRYSVDRK
ncbi:DoxX family protein [Aquirhabdus parva]|uniref:DoxX family protein n=1 Tax=Aquirhabdus parva TaxID=2283318 RepID=A0A345P6M1_9GAMM|nr:DoxX family protein [Aquirhabdus parva]AXI02930.1 DoxX family protein [Aquirhabdus parva]